MLLRSLTRIAVCTFVVICGAAQAATPVSVAVHGPTSVYEGSSADYAAVVSWSDGTRSSEPVLWSSSNPALASISSAGKLLTGLVANNTTVTVRATYGALPLASLTVTVIDASSFPSIAPPLIAGWNLLGNSIGAPINTVSVFGDQVQPVSGITEKVLSVWKWDAVNAKWAFFTPTKTPSQLADYAAGHGYSVLQVIQPGEGYWVNAAQPANLLARSGGSVSLATSSIVNAWNLMSTGQAVTPPALNTLVSDVPPAPGTVAQSFVSLWAWDAASAKWLFYAPSLEAAGGLAAVKAYCDAHGYLDFATLGRTLGHGVGFWINSTTANANSNLAPLGQAKAMFSELRTTVRAYSNDLKGGFLDQQSTRIQNDLNGKVAPQLHWAIRYWDLIEDATRLVDNVRSGQTSSYSVQAGTVGGSVRASINFFNGTAQVSCFSNNMVGAQVTPGLLTDVSCAWVNPSYSLYSSDFPNLVYNFQGVKVAAGATSDAFSYQAIKRQMVQTFNGFTFQTVSDTQIGPTRNGIFTRTYLGTTTNLSSISFVGDLPAEDAADDHDTVSVTGTRSVRDAVNNIYRSSISGSIASKSASGVPMVTISLGSGSYFDSKQDANGNELPNSLQAVHVVGIVETGATRFTGVLDLGAFAADADNERYLPTSLVFDGSAEDLSSGGAGTFLTGRLNVILNNLVSFHAGQPESASNFMRFDFAFVGTIQAPSRPPMRLTAGSSRTTLDTYSITTNYTYGSFSVTGTGVLNTANNDNSVLSITNQDGVTVTFQPHADANVLKGGSTLGIIPFGSAIVYYIDGYFESL